MGPCILQPPGAEFLQQLAPELGSGPELHLAATSIPARGDPEDEPRGTARSQVSVFEATAFVAICGWATNAHLPGSSLARHILRSIPSLLTQPLAEAWHPGSATPPARQDCRASQATDLTGCHGGNQR